MPDSRSDRTVEKLLRQQAALVSFGSFASREPDLLKLLTEAARICAAALDVPFCTVGRYRALENDFLIEAAWGWKPGVVGRITLQADERSPQARAYVTGTPVIIRTLQDASTLALPAFYGKHGIVSTVDVVIPAVEGAPYGVLGIHSSWPHQCDVHDVSFLTGFARMLAEAIAAATRANVLRALVGAKELMAEELQHRVRNNLQSVSGMLERFAWTTADEEARQGIELIVRRVITLAQVYDSLLGIGLSETVDLADYLRALCVSLPELQAERSRPVQIVCRTEVVLLGLDVVTALGMAVAELVTNSYGHAFPDQDGTIRVTLARTQEDSATITIQDNGVGFKAEAESARHGLGLARKLVEQIGGTLDVHSGNGTRWTLAFAVPVTLDEPKAAA